MTVAVLLLPAVAAAEEPLTADQAVRLGVERSPAVLAARARLEGAEAGARAAGAGFNPQVGATPGVGFTESTALLSQQIDIGGRLRARRRAATGEVEAARAEVEVARLGAGAEIRAAYFDLARAREAAAAAAESLGLAERVRDLVRRRVEIGEAPQVQVVRAEIEVARAEQETARARGAEHSRRAALNVLLGREPGAPLGTTEELAVPDAAGPLGALVQQARRGRPELVALRALVRARGGDVQAARAESRPELFAEAAADVWSLDRDAFRSRNLGFQMRLSFPLFDRGSLQAGVDRAQAAVREQEAALLAAEQAMTVEVEQAAAELAAARAVALGYRERIVPQASALLAATQRGFENGLSSFLEVAEALRVLRQTRTEALDAVSEAVHARLRLERALGAVPGLPAAAPPPQPRRRR